MQAHSGLRLCIDLSYNPLTMQEQLGDIGEDLGLAQPSPAEPDYTSQPADDVRRANMSYSFFIFFARYCVFIAFDISA